MIEPVPFTTASHVRLLSPTEADRLAPVSAVGWIKAKGKDGSWRFVTVPARPHHRLKSWSRAATIEEIRAEINRYRRRDRFWRRRPPRMAGK